MEKVVQYVQQVVASPFFNRAEELTSAWRIVVWWEGRRLFFNLLVGVAGVITVALCFVSALIGEKFLQIPIGLPDPPIFALFAVLAYGIMANVCSTGG